MTTYNLAFDQVTGASFVSFGDIQNDQVVETAAVDAGVYLDLDKTGDVLGVELYRDAELPISELAETFGKNFNELQRIAVALDVERERFDNRIHD